MMTTVIGGTSDRSTGRGPEQELDHCRRNERVVANLDLVDKVVRTLPCGVLRHWTFEELRSFGTLGLIDAANRFTEEAGDGDSYTRYAKRRIRGAIFDELRRLDWLPRTLRQQVMAYQRAENDLRAASGAEPSVDEVMGVLGVRGTSTARGIAGALGGQYVESIDAPNDGGDGRRAPSLAVADDTERAALDAIDRELLHAALGQLSERQRDLLRCRFDQEMTLEQTATHLGLSRTRVHQLEAAALQRLRSELSASIAA